MKVIDEIRKHSSALGRDLTQSEIINVIQAHNMKEPKPLKKPGTIITEANLIKLGFVLDHTHFPTAENGPYYKAGILKIFKYPGKMAYVGIDDRNLGETGDRQGFYNTNTFLEEVKEALKEN
jgi:hypothetical protein